MRDFKPILKVGGTVMLAPECRLKGAYLPGLKSFQPYKVLEIDTHTGWIQIHTQDGKRSYLIHYFEPVCQKFGLFESVKIRLKSKGIFSRAMLVLGYKDGKYLLQNGSYYDVADLVSVRETVNSWELPKADSATEQFLPL